VKPSDADLVTLRRLCDKAGSDAELVLWLEQLPPRRKKGSKIGELQLFRTAWICRVAKKELRMPRTTALRWCVANGRHLRLGANTGATVFNLRRLLETRSFTNAELDTFMRSRGYDPRSATFGAIVPKKPFPDAPPVVEFFRIK
jgi:hypothetical protein